MSSMSASIIAFDLRFTLIFKMGALLTHTLVKTLEFLLQQDWMKVQRTNAFM